MGEVITRKRLEEGRVASGDGSSQVIAARAICRIIRNYNQAGSFQVRRSAPPELIALQKLFGNSNNEQTRSRNFEVAFQGYGSTFTNRAGRRGDVDMLVGWARLESGMYVRSRTSEQVIEQDIFVKSLIKMIKDVAACFHVHAEARFVSMVDTREGTSDLLHDDPLFLDHIARASLQWRIGDPLQNLRNRAINIEEPLSTLQESQIAATALKYMSLKAAHFASAIQWLEEVEKGEFDFEMWQQDEHALREDDSVEIAKSTEELKCQTLQRILEFAKAAVRKMIAVNVVEGRQEVSADVTSRSDMYRRFQAMTEVIDKSGAMKQNHACLIELDGKYDEILEQTIAERTFKEYEKWIHEQLIAAAEIAYRLAAQCHRYIENVVESKEMVITHFPGYYDDTYRLVTLDDVGIGGPIVSSSAPLSSGRLQ